jgi:hypothetical protein
MGCPLCTVSLQAVRSYLDSVMYEYVNAPDVRETLTESRGYCHEHASWLTEGYGRELGAAIVYRDVVAALCDAIQSTPPGGRRYAQELHRRLQPTAECPACVYRRRMEERTLRALLRHLDREELQTALGGSSGLCLPHLLQGLELGRRSPALEQLVSLEGRALSKLRNQLGEFIRKSDYRFADEDLGEEGDSWLRAIMIVSGAHGVR